MTGEDAEGPPFYRGKLHKCVDEQKCFGLCCQPRQLWDAWKVSSRPPGRPRVVPGVPWPQAINRIDQVTLSSACSDLCQMHPLHFKCPRLEAELAVAPWEGRATGSRITNTFATRHLFARLMTWFDLTHCFKMFQNYIRYAETGSIVFCLFLPFKCFGFQTHANHFKPIQNPIIETFLECLGYVWNCLDSLCAHQIPRVWATAYWRDGLQWTWTTVLSRDCPKNRGHATRLQRGWKWWRWACRDLISGYFRIFWTLLDYFKIF